MIEVVREFNMEEVQQIEVKLARGDVQRRGLHLPVQCGSAGARPRAGRAR